MQFHSISIVLTATLLASGAMASGNHAGGHHGDAAAIGKPGKASKVSRSVTIDMADTMRFTPADVTVQQGETIRFIVNNRGKLKHEMVLGTEKELKEHYEVMKKHPEMEHADPNQVTVEPGKSGEIIWQFTQAGRVDFACLHPGHYDAGMKGAVTVSANTNTKAKASDGHGNHKH